MYTFILDEKHIEDYKELAKAYGYESLGEFIEICVGNYIKQYPKYNYPPKPINNNLSGMVGWSRN